MPYKMINNIAAEAKKNNMLEHIVNKLNSKFGLIPVIGAEIEFYCHSDNARNITEYIFKKEKGNGQFEIDIFPQENIYKTIEEITKAKAFLSSLPNSTIHPKPYSNDYGSAMHFHINLLNRNGENFFDNSDNLENAAKSLCHFLKSHFLIFAPKTHHYSRFDKDFMAPTHICFGGNNRSTAIRIPDVKPKRLEHRISSPETDEYLAICAILEAIYQGITHPASIQSYAKIHGNAFDEQYNLTPLPATIEEAIKLYKF